MVLLLVGPTPRDHEFTTGSLLSHIMLDGRYIGTALFYLFPKRPSSYWRTLHLFYSILYVRLLLRCSSAMLPCWSKIMFLFILVLVLILVLVHRIYSLLIFSNREQKLVEQMCCSERYTKLTLMLLSSVSSNSNRLWVFISHP